MDPTVVIARGGSIYLVQGRSPVRTLRASRFPGPGEAGPHDRELLESLRDWAGAEPVVAVGVELSRRLSRELGRAIPRASPAQLRRAMDALPPLDLGAERTRALAQARADLDAALRAPEEILVSLAREEERLERSIGREARAAEAFVAVPATVLDEVAASSARARGALEAHHRDVLRRLEDEARRTVPNLSAIVGARTAARLVAAAGGVLPLARMASSRLQLLGSHRRPDPERGPRYGALYLAEGGDELPPDRRAAYARSVAALAVIAVRADAFTRADVARGLLRRREARVRQLARGRR